MADPVIPDELRANVTGVFGARGAKWLDRLPGHLDLIANRWGIRIGPTFPQLSFNYVALATDAAGRAVVLKAGVPSNGLRHEIGALRAYGGRGAVRLLRANRDLGAMLLERLNPGTMLSETEDDEAATRIAAKCMREMAVELPAGHRFPHVANWAEGFAGLRGRYVGGTGTLPIRAVERAEGLFAELLRTPGPTALLHGDLHHYNILSDGDGWRVIDPKGIAGDPAYECGAWLRNPGDLLERTDVRGLLARRVAVFDEELGYGRDRIRDWAYAQAILSAWWCIEDGSDCWEDSLEIAGHLSAGR